MRGHGFVAAVAVLAAFCVAGCGEHEQSEKEGRAAEKTVEHAAETVEQNVEHSAKVEGKTYETDRKEGTGPVESAGDAYEAVLEIPGEKAAKESAEPTKKDEKQAATTQ